MWQKAAEASWCRLPRGQRCPSGSLPSAARTWAMIASGPCSAKISRKLAPAAVLAAAARRSSPTVPSRGCPGRRPRGLPRGRRWVATPIMGTLLTSRIPWNHSSRGTSWRTLASEGSSSYRAALPERTDGVVGPLQSEPRLFESRAKRGRWLKDASIGRTALREAR
jgi:hypothetical protein